MLFQVEAGLSCKSDVLNSNFDNLLVLNYEEFIPHKYFSFELILIKLKIILIEEYVNWPEYFYQNKKRKEKGKE